MFIRIIHKFTNEVQVVDELTDFLFEEGYRLLEYVNNGSADIFEVDEVKRQNSLRQWGF
jgi:hypothetical protein